MEDSKSSYREGTYEYRITYGKIKYSACIDEVREKIYPSPPPFSLSFARRIDSTRMNFRDTFDPRIYRPAAIHDNINVKWIEDYREGRETASEILAEIPR